ncbi:hypothetical protein ACKC9G_13160 [Pokkaliibacter sp. CJK22405]|uniref:hypothetical protein n=1 Tax=Pokkaliibacter sp. CJK22405 TaxID=3384615 RepID=UPI003984B51E
MAPALKVLASPAAQSLYTETQKRKVSHLAGHFERQGMPVDEARAKAWATLHNERDTSGQEFTEPERAQAQGETQSTSIMATRKAAMRDSARRAAVERRQRQQELLRQQEQQERDIMVARTKRDRSRQSSLSKSSSG